MSKMIEIKGKKVSEDTVVEALKKLINFEEGNKYQFKAGDVGLYEGDNNFIRLILCPVLGSELISFSIDRGYPLDTAGQKMFEEYNYKYIGKISDFINKETIKRFLINGKV